MTVGYLPAGSKRHYGKLPAYDKNKDGKITNAERHGLQWLVAPLNALEHGAWSAVNDIANTINPEPGYEEYMLVTDGPVIREPDSIVGQIGSGLTRFGSLYGLPFGALRAAGMPLLASLPASGAAMGFAVDPTSDAYLTIGDMAYDYGPESWGDDIPLVRYDDDTELTRRLKGSASGAIEGMLLDVPAAKFGIGAAAPLYGGYMFGLPYGLEKMRSSETTDYGWTPEQDAYRLTPEEMAELMSELDIADY